MSTPYLSEIKMFGFDWAPRGWALCNGQLLPINQNQALFALLGTTYGGNGQTTFGLPNLQGKTMFHFGQSPGGSNFFLGQSGGEINHTILGSEMPVHTHALSATTNTADSVTPGSNMLAQNGSAPMFTTTANSLLHPNAIGVAGSSQPHANMQPYLVISLCISLQGIFPSRN